MATEATSENFAAPSITSDNELNTTQSKVQDVPSEQIPNVNGIITDKDGGKPNTDLLESINTSAEVSEGGGSDSEATKAESSKLGDEKGGHVRSTSAVKKPTAFKAVSVNKTFLASKASVVTAPSKLGDKPPSTSTSTTPTSAIASSTPRPRLVAKSGSGLRDSTPKASNGSNGGKPGGAPDASAVWNKNRPAPPPEPKRFTDEELKQRYGIHLATRLQSDDPGKQQQANWADIDDDDDDWAPESIEWTDGTKITLPTAEESQPPPPEPVPAVKEIKHTEPVPKPSRSPAPQPTSSPIPKPSGFGSGRAGLVLKGASEKPTLVAKPPGPPTPVKSPWATLPPVEKVAPVAIEIPHPPPQQSRFNQRDPHSFSGMPPPPAKEIAADDFSRTWRDGNAHAGRELYNSQSGRYEPVQEGRRGGSRNDGPSRGPAVLQRPSQQDGPAEPSPAFQTHRAAIPDGAYGRRRTSSNVSGGSGNFGRRMSRGHDMPPPHEMLSARRGSLAAVSDAPSSPGNFSPSGQQFQQQQRGYPGQPWTRASPVVSHPSPQSLHGQLTPGSSDVYMHGQGPPQLGVVPNEDPMEEQKALMRRARELAIKRRQETEAKEEAERKERIRIKLEAMGPPPEKKKTKDESAIEEKTATISIKTRESEQSSNTDGQIDGNKDLTIMNPNVAQRHAESSSTAQDSRPNHIYQSNSHSAAPTQQFIPDNRNSQSWQKTSASNSGTDKFTTPWAGAPPPTQSSSRIWGPPTNERTIGNGTFNPDLNRLPDMSHQSGHPGPIGPPGAMRGGAHFQSSRGGHQYGAQRPTPIGPPTIKPKTAEEEQRSARARAVWGNVPKQIAEEDAVLRKQQEEEMERKRELEAAGIFEEVRQPVYKDTFKQVQMNEDGTRGKTKSITTTINDARSNQASSSAFGENIPHQNNDLSRPQFNNAWRPGHDMSAAQPTRDSRFFPTNRDNRFEGEDLNRPSFDRPSSPSPPPPTMFGHPAYDGDVVHPHVALPPPLPVVRLPPTTVIAPIAPPRPHSFAAAVAAPAVPAINQIPGFAGRQNSARASYDIRNTESAANKGGEWRDKINNLFNRTSPARSNALTVDSASRHALDHSESSQIPATVSLPGSTYGPLSDDDESVLTKPAAEECFEEQEMGSLPVVKPPLIVPQSLWDPAPAAPKNIPRKFVVADVTSIDNIPFPKETTNNNDIYVIMVPGQETARSVQVPAARAKSNPRRGRGGSRQASSTHSRGGRTRDTSSGFASSAREASSPTPSTSNRGRGGRGFGGNHWTRHVATPVHT